MKKVAKDTVNLERTVADSRHNRELREQSYRDKALKLYPWICGRCCREFDRSNLYELTVHHRDHNHDNNPDDGSNWELLCIYCHENEHSRYLDNEGGLGSEQQTQNSKATHKPFEGLKDLLKTRS